MIFSITQMHRKKTYVQRETANHLFNHYCLDASGSSWDQKHHATSLLKAINTRLPQAVQQKSFHGISKFSLNVPMYIPSQEVSEFRYKYPTHDVNTWCKHCNCYHFGQNLVFFLLARNQVYCVTPYVASLHTLDIPQIAIAFEFLECPSTTSWSPLCDTDELMMRVN